VTFLLLELLLLLFGVSTVGLSHLQRLSSFIFFFPLLTTLIVLMTAVFSRLCAL